MEIFQTYSGNKTFILQKRSIIFSDRHGTDTVTVTDTRQRYRGILPQTYIHVPMYKSRHKYGQIHCQMTQTNMKTHRYRNRRRHRRQSQTQTQTHTVQRYRHRLWQLQTQLQTYQHRHRHRHRHSYSHTNTVTDTGTDTAIDIPTPSQTQAQTQQGSKRSRRQQFMCYVLILVFCKHIFALIAPLVSFLSLCFFAVVFADI